MTNAKQKPSDRFKGISITPGGTGVIIEPSTSESGLTKTEFKDGAWIEEHLNPEEAKKYYKEKIDPIFNKPYTNFDRIRAENNAIKAKYAMDTKIGTIIGENTESKAQIDFAFEAGKADAALKNGLIGQDSAASTDTDSN